VAMSLSERLERRAVEALAGRGAELQRLQVFTFGDGPPVMHIQGIPGVGKTHLLNALAAIVGAKSVFVVRIDARWCEPSPAAFCRAICRQIGVPESRCRGGGVQAVWQGKANSPATRQLRVFSFA